MTIEDLKIFLSNLTVVEACKLALDLEEAWGIKQPRYAPVPRLAAAYGAPMPPTKRIIYKYYLTSVGSNPVYLMKILRQHLGWGLEKVKQAVASGEVLLLETQFKSDADALMKDLEEIGAKIEVREEKTLAALS